MLITLTSADSNNNSRFRCNFNESLRLPPNSEVGLINASINRLKLIQITDKIYNQSGAKENVGRVRFSNTDPFTDVVIPVGDYSLEALANALTSAFITIASNLGYSLIQKWSVLDITGDGDQTKLEYNWDWKGTSKPPVLQRPIWINNQTTDPADYTTADDPLITPSGKTFKTSPTSLWDVGLYSGQYIAEKNAQGNGGVIWAVGNLGGANEIGIGYAREQFIKGTGGSAGSQYYQLIDWAIKVNADDTFEIWETPNDDPSKNDLNVWVKTGSANITATTKFRIIMEYDGTVKYYFWADSSDGGNYSLEYTSTKKKTTPTDFGTNGIVVLGALKNQYDSVDNEGGGFFTTQINAHDNSVSKAIGGDNVGDNNSVVSQSSTHNYLDFYTPNSKVNVNYVDATDPEWRDNGNAPDPNNPDDLVERSYVWMDTPAPNTLYDIYKSYRHKEISHNVKGLTPMSNNMVRITINDLDEFVGTRLDKDGSGANELSREKVKVYFNGDYYGEIIANKGNGANQTITKDFHSVYANEDGHIKVEIAQGFSWINGVNPDHNTQSGIRLEEITVAPNHYYINRPDDLGVNNFRLGQQFYNENGGGIDPLSVGAPSQKITFEPKQLGKYIGFFQPEYFSNGANSSVGSVGTQSGAWYGDMVEFNGVASRIMVDIENLPIATANSQTHNRSHTIANIPRFSQGGSNLGNIYYEASTPLYIKLKNPDEIILNYLDVVLRDSNGIAIDEGILDTNSVVVINIQ